MILLNHVLNLSNSEDTILPNCELFIAVVNPSINYNIAIVVIFFISKFKKEINLLGIHFLVFSRTEITQTLTCN